MWGMCSCKEGREIKKKNGGGGGEFYEKSLHPCDSRISLKGHPCLSGLYMCHRNH